MCFSLSKQAAAGAWTQKQGHGFYKLSLRVVRADQFYEPGGNRISIPTLGEYTTIFYGEYGLNDWLTLVANAHLFKRITLNKQVGEPSGFVFFNGDSKSGVADSEIGVRLGLIRGGSFVLSTEILLGLPVGDNNQSNGLFTGDGEFNQLVKLQFGHSFYPKPLYLIGEVGFNNRTRGFSDEFHYGLELGYTLKKLLLSFKLRGVESLENGDAAVLGGVGGLFANNQRYLAFGPEINYLLNETLGLSLSVDGAARGENVLSAAAYTIGVFLKK